MSRFFIPIDAVTSQPSSEYVFRANYDGSVTAITVDPSNTDYQDYLLSVAPTPQGA